MIVRRLPCHGIDLFAVAAVLVSASAHAEEEASSNSLGKVEYSRIVYSPSAGALLSSPPYGEPFVVEASFPKNETSCFGLAWKECDRDGNCGETACPNTPSAEVHFRPTGDAPPASDSSGFEWGSSCTPVASAEDKLAKFEILVAPRQGRGLRYEIEYMFCAYTARTRTQCEVSAEVYTIRAEINILLSAYEHNVQSMKAYPSIAINPSGILNTSLNELSSKHAATSDTTSFEFIKTNITQIAVKTENIDNTKTNSINSYLTSFNEAIPQLVNAYHTLCVCDDSLPSCPGQRDLVEGALTVLAQDDDYGTQARKCFISGTCIPTKSASDGIVVFEKAPPGERRKLAAELATGWKQCVACGKCTDTLGNNLEGKAFSVSALLERVAASHVQLADLEKEVAALDAELSARLASQVAAIPGERIRVKTGIQRSRVKLEQVMLTADFGFGWFAFGDTGHAPPIVPFSAGVNFYLHPVDPNVALWESVLPWYGTFHPWYKWVSLVFGVTVSSFQRKDLGIRGLLTDDMTPFLGVGLRLHQNIRISGGATVAWHNAGAPLDDEDRLMVGGFARLSLDINVWKLLKDAVGIFK
ncbi:MAG: hypothetical protein FJ109_10825 [Deltaproteobacteria bacterium]|nr:hypothetical protein [Deltaproteobacteria bacterium]